MEKMLDKKSRDFAKNMRDTMIYDKSKNEVQIGTNLYVDGIITQNGGSIGGTKLYKHYLIDSSETGYKFIVITTNYQPINFSVLNDSEKMYNYLLTQNIIRFTTDSGNNIQYDNIRDKSFYSIRPEFNGSETILITDWFDDWGFSDTSDTVTEL